tara:strand:+ start:1223 stop:1459 length:237 start_codon:yes stop_codon:yes gene_type:complete
MPKKKTRKRSVSKKASSKKLCNFCGGSSCVCQSHIIVRGVVLLLLGILLWANVLDLRLTVALLLVLWGIKKIAWGFHA